MNAIRPYLKAVLPALLTLIAVLVQWGVTGAFDKAELVQWGVTGAFDKAELVTAITGFTASLLTFLAKNEPAV
jgi:hypothetical protein